MSDFGAVFSDARERKTAGLSTAGSAEVNVLGAFQKFYTEERWQNARVAGRNRGENEKEERGSSSDQKGRL